MTSPTDPPSGAHANGSKSVTNADLQSALQILGLELQLELKDISAKLENVATQQTADGKRFEVLASQVTQNAQEILKVRSSIHENAQSIQSIELRTAPLTLPISNEIVAGMEEIRRGIKLLRENELRVVLTDPETQEIRDLLRKNAQGKLEYVEELKTKDASEKLAYVETLMKDRAKKTMVWGGFSREFLLVAFSVIGLVVFGPILAELINHFLFGKPF